MSIDRAGKMIRVTTAAAVAGVAVVAAVVSYEHAYALVSAHGETGIIAHLEPLTIDGLIFAASMVLLDSARRNLPVPALARWLLGLGIAATLTANVLHGLSHGPVGAAVAAWPAVSLVGSYELLMGMIRRVPAAPEPAGYAPADAPSADYLPSGVAAMFGDQVAAGIVPSIRQIRRELRCGQPRAQEVQAYLTGMARS
ncbi:MAG TPA: DUF2637 domain-containing protein [Streptosporangiaceae bacterium]|jgi:hypothetical protein